MPSSLGRLILGLALAALASTGCGDGESSGNPSDRAPTRSTAGDPAAESEADYEAMIAGWPSPPSEAEWTDEDSQRVAAACQGCHLLPPPDALPRARWRRTIPNMTTYPVPEGLDPLTPEQLAWALADYERRAPEELSVLPVSEPPIRRFSRADYTPAALARERIPAVAQVQFVPMNDPPHLDVLITELRTSTLMVLPPWAPEAHRVPRPIQGQLDYPARALLRDLNADGRFDIVIAAMGAINPTDLKSGGVYDLIQRADRGFDRVLVQDDLGRACDVQLGDLDGDGDLDRVVSAFGWKSAGELVLLENLAGEPGARYERRRLDDRDGFLQTDLFDLDQDGDLDIIAAVAQQHEEVLVFLNDGAGRFTSRLLYRAPHAAWGLSGFERVDLDGDGDQDLLVSNGDTLDDHVLKPYHGVGWLENRGGLEFVYRRVADLYGCEAATAADMDGDGDLDVVAVSFLPQISPAVWKRGPDGSGPLDSVVWIEQTPTGWRKHAIEQGRCYHPTLDVGDYDLDGDLDVVVGNYVWLPADGQPSIRADYVTVFTRE